MEENATHVMAMRMFVHMPTRLVTMLVTVEVAIEVLLGLLISALKQHTVKADIPCGHGLLQIHACAWHGPDDRKSSDHGGRGVL